MRKLLFFLLFAAELTLWMHADTHPVSDLRRELEAEALLFEHPEDVEISIQELRGRGAGDKELSEALLQIAYANVTNANEESVRSAVCRSAIYWYGRLCPGDDLTNLLSVARMATNDLARTAVRTYQRRHGDVCGLVAFAGEVFAGVSVEPLMVSEIWTALEKEARNGVRSRKSVLAFARRQALNVRAGLYGPDKILMRYDADYKGSALCKEVRELVFRLALTGRLPVSARTYFNRLEE